MLVHEGNVLMPVDCSHDSADWYILDVFPPLGFSGNFVPLALFDCSVIYVDLRSHAIKVHWRPLYWRWIEK